MSRIVVSHKNTRLDSSGPSSVRSCLTKTHLWDSYESFYAFLNAVGVFSAVWATWNVGCWFSERNQGSIATVYGHSHPWTSVPQNIARLPARKNMSPEKLHALQARRRETITQSSRLALPATISFGMMIQVCWVERASPALQRERLPQASECSSIIAPRIIETYLSPMLCNMPISWSKVLFESAKERAFSNVRNSPSVGGKERRRARASTVTFSPQFKHMPVLADIAKTGSRCHEINDVR